MVWFKAHLLTGVHERHTVVRALPILYVLKEGTTDVLKRPKNLLSRYIPY